jgi:hypothetical protein
MTASSDGIPVISGPRSATKRKHKDTEERLQEDAALRARVSTSFHVLSMAAMQSSWTAINKQWLDIKMMAMDAGRTQEEKSFLNDQAAKLETTKDALEKQLAAQFKD